MERSGREECREKLTALPSPPRALRAIRKNRRTQAAGGRSGSEALFAAGEIFPDGGLNGPVRDLRDERHAGMVTASMNSRRKSAMAFPAIEFTASDDGLAGVAATRKPPNTRPSSTLRACPKLPFRTIDGIAAPIKLAPLRHCNRRQRNRSNHLRATPLLTACARPPEPEIQEGWLSNLTLEAMVSAASPRLRHHRVRRSAPWLALLNRHPPAERAFASGIEAEGRNAKGGSVHESPARGACPRAGAIHGFEW